MKTAAAYIRVSDERQDEFSPDSQLKRIREYCDKNGIELPDELIFCDDGISAKSVKNRKQFNDMIALAKLKDKPFEIILVWKFSRFARNQEESIVYKSLLRKNGVEVISISEPLSDNPFGGLIERIIEWMDEYYLIRLGDEVRRGMTERATRGLPNTAPPFGYRMVNGKYEVVEEEAATVSLIFDSFIAGAKIRALANRLNAEGIKNRYGNPIDSRGIEYILNNPCYIGYLRWNPNGKSASKRNFNNPEDILKKGDHEPIISEDVWNRAQFLLEQRRKASLKYARENFEAHDISLKGLVKCNTCGATLVYNKRNNGLQCHKYAKGLCDVSHFISLPAIEKAVIEAMKESVASLEFNVASDSDGITVSVSDNYDRIINKLELKLDRVKYAYEDGVYTLEEYKKSKKYISEEIRKYKERAEKARASESNVDLKDFARTVSDVIEIVENPNTSQELKNRALKSILQKVVFYKPEKRVELFYYV